MSTDATSYVWKLTKEQVTPTEKLILLSLADRANEEHECWPSQKRLEVDTGLDRKTIIKAIQKAEKKGILIKTGEKKGAQKRVNVYRFIAIKGRENEQVEQDFNSPKNGTIKPFNSPKSGTINSPKNGTQNLSVEPPNKNTHKAVCGFPFFNEFWSLFPVKKAEKACLAIWKKRGLESIGQQIVDALKNQKENDRQWLAGFNPSAKTYIFEDRWNDEITLSPEAIKSKEREQQRLEAEQREKEQAAFSEQQRQNDLNKQNDAKVFRNIKQAVKGNGYAAFRASMNLKDRENEHVHGE